MIDHQQEAIEEDFPDKSIFSMDHFVRKWDSIYSISNSDDNIQIQDKYLEEYSPKIKSWFILIAQIESILPMYFVWIHFVDI